MEAMGKLKKVNAYFRITRWRSTFWNDLYDVLYSRIPEARKSAQWFQEWGVGDYCPSFPYCQASLFLLAFIICPCFSNTVFMTGNIQKFASSPTLKAESSESNILRMGWGLKAMSKGRCPSADPMGLAGLVSLLPQNAFATQTTKGLIVALSQTPRDQT